MQLKAKLGHQISIPKISGTLAMYLPKCKEKTRITQKQIHVGNYLLFPFLTVEIYCRRS